MGLPQPFIPENIIAVVEATDFERFTLWELWHRQTPLVKVWDDETRAGLMVQLGDFHGMPVNICLSLYTLDGHTVCFWHAISQVVDYHMVDEWKDTTFGRKTVFTNAANFHIAIHAIEDANEKN